MRQNFMREIDYGTAPFRTFVSDREVVPWLDGQGTTQVVAAADQWRVTITEEPTEWKFSVMEEYDRLLTPIGSVPIELAGRPFRAPWVEVATEVHHRVEPLETFAFPGEWAPMSRASRRTRTLNVMGRRGLVRMRVQVGSTAIPVHPGSVRIYVDLASEAAVIMPPGDFEPPSCPGMCAVISIASLAD